MKKCFVVSPIGDDESDVRKRSDQLFSHIIMPVCEDNEFQVNRADKMDNSGAITEAIIQELIHSDLVIADLTDHNPNVFYEIGFRTSTNKPIIHFCERNTGLPFDVVNIRTVKYCLTDLDDVAQVKNKLDSMIKGIVTQDLCEPSSDYHQSSQLSTVIQMLYGIEDAIKALSVDVKSKQNETVNTLIDALKSGHADDPQTAMMKTLIPALLSNPESIVRLSETLSKLPKK